MSQRDIEDTTLPDAAPLSHDISFETIFKAEQAVIEARTSGVRDHEIERTVPASVHRISFCGSCPEKCAGVGGGIGSVGGGKGVGSGGGSGGGSGSGSGGGGIWFMEFLLVAVV